MVKVLIFIILWVIISKSPLMINRVMELIHGMWRLKENATRNGNLYPTHGLGPVCQVMNINRGDKMDYLSSFSTNDFTMGPKEKELSANDPFYAEWKNSVQGKYEYNTCKNNTWEDKYDTA